MHMDEGARRWILKTARTNYWRVSAIYEFEDLLQDGQTCFYAVVRRYKDEIKSQAHGMSLFQRKYLNHIHDLAKQCAKTRDAIDLDLIQDTLADNQQQLLLLLSTALSKAPAPVRAVLQLFGNQEALLQLSAPYRKGPNRETHNERLCRLTGYDPKVVDLVGAVKNFLSRNVSEYV